MFRSLMTIIRELYLYLTKVIHVFMLKQSVKLRRYINYVTWQHVVVWHLYRMRCGVSLTEHCTQYTCRSAVSLCTAHNTHAALQSHCALHTTHMPLYILTVHCTQHKCCSTVSLCTAHNTRRSTVSLLTMVNEDRYM
jgi:hypothetical protein